MDVTINMGVFCDVVPGSLFQRCLLLPSSGRKTFVQILKYRFRITTNFVVMMMVGNSAESNFGFYKRRRIID